MLYGNNKILAKDVLNELFLFSGQFALFYIIMQLAKSGRDFLGDFGHIILIIALLIQSFLLARFGEDPKIRICGTFIVPLAYSLMEIQEGLTYVLNAAHMGFWVYAVISCFLQMIYLKAKKRSENYKSIELLIVAVTIILFIYLYFYFDVAMESSDQSELMVNRIFLQLPVFLSDSSHLYIIFGGMILAAILGLGRLELVNLKDRIKELFGRYVDTSIRDIILEDQNIQAKRDVLCIMFSDIRNFTTLNEANEPARVTEMLNIYFDRWAGLVEKHHGVIDKFIGDAVMMIFGLGSEGETGSIDAVQCGWEMLGTWESLKDELQSKGLPIPEGFGIGAHYGELVIGNIGSSNRRDFTVIGDTVNIASRLESLNKEKKSRFLISREVLNCLPEEIRIGFNRIGKQKLKGRQESVELWGLIRN